MGWDRKVEARGLHGEEGIEGGLRSCIWIGERMNCLSYLDRRFKK
jgi:hypothetical protein